jgi:hypothetical protein
VAPRSRRTPAQPAPDTSVSPGIRLGHLVEGATTRRLLVDFDGNPGEPRVARAAVVLDARGVAQAIRERQKVVLLFEGTSPPIVLGLVLQEPSETPLLDELLSPVPRGRPLEARVDGKRVVIEGQDQVVLRCGEASITLRRDGKVVVRGRYVETHASGTNRIKGGAVKIN